MAKSEKFDPYEAITTKIITAIERGNLPWRKRWSGSGSSMPMRSCGTPYRGINILSLWATAEECQFVSPFWMTYKQALNLGGQVRKGEKSTTIVKYGTYERENDLSGEDEAIPYLKAYRVFNADQVDGLGDDFAGDKQADMGTRPVAELDAFFTDVGANITHGGARACFNIIEDRVHMPPVSAFITDRHYYATLSHEITHWSGHSSRLDRFKAFGDKDDYAFEELVAEIGACFLGAQIGVEPITDESAAYVDHWLKVMRKDNKIIFKAAAQAQRAADYILECANRSTEQNSKSA